MDARVLAGLYEDLGADELVMGQFVETFQRAGRGRADEARVSAALGDWERMRLEAHTLKSSAATVGATRLSAFVASAEAAARREEHDPALLDELVLEMERVARLLTDWHRLLGVPLAAAPAPPGAQDSRRAKGDGS